MILAERMWTTAEVAAALRVDTKTVYRWAKDGKIEARRTPGGWQWRYPDSVMQELLRGERDADAAARLAFAMDDDAATRHIMRGDEPG